MVHYFKKKFLIIIVAGFCLSLIAGANAWATTIALTDDGPRYWEVVESVEDVMGYYCAGFDDDGALIIEYGHVGYRINYDIFNNSTYTINGFMVGVLDDTGNGADNETSAGGWSGYVTNRWNYPNDGNYWNNYLGLEDYDYAYHAEVVMGFGEPDNPDYFPPGEALSPFQGITGEFSFESDSDGLSSPVILFATDSGGNEVVLFGESSYSRGTGQNYIPGAPVPVPGTIILLGLGLLGLTGIARKQKQ
jgi:hypothetical protein